MTRTIQRRTATTVSRMPRQREGASSEALGINTARRAAQGRTRRWTALVVLTMGVILSAASTAWLLVHTGSGDRAPADARRGEDLVRLLAPPASSTPIGTRWSNPLEAVVGALPLHGDQAWRYQDGLRVSVQRVKTRTLAGTAPSVKERVEVYIGVINGTASPVPLRNATLQVSSGAGSHPVRLHTLSGSDDRGRLRADIGQRIQLWGGMAIPHGHARTGLTLGITPTPRYESAEFYGRP